MKTFEEYCKECNYGVERKCLWCGVQKEMCEFSWNAAIGSMEERRCLDCKEYDKPYHGYCSRDELSHYADYGCVYWSKK